MRGLLLAGILLVMLYRPAEGASSTGFAASPGLLCRQAIAAAEQAHAIPGQLLAAIGRVESGRRDDQGNVMPWPWTINAEGQGTFFDTKAQAIAAVRALQAQGVRSIDVGCMQVNLMHHPDAFANLEAAFDPMANADYAAGFLRRLFAQTNDWTEAAADYHSSTPALGAEYRQKVMTAWGQAPQRSPLATAWAATLGTPFGSSRSIGFGTSRSMLTAPPAVMPGVAGSGPVGRSLAAYRAAPIMIVGPGRAGG